MAIAAERVAADGLYVRIGDCLRCDAVPSLTLRHIASTPAFSNFPFSMLKKLEKTPQSPKHHPEGSVWNHTLMVVDAAAQRRAESADPRVFMWAALLHDVGKPDTTRVRRDRITAYEHDKTGARLTRKFLSFFTNDDEFVDRVAVLVRYHMHLLYVVNDLPFKDMTGLITRADPSELALLCLCDRLGRAGADKTAEETYVRQFTARIEAEKRRRNGQSGNEAARSVGAAWH